MFIRIVVSLCLTMFTSSLNAQIRAGSAEDFEFRRKLQERADDAWQDWSEAIKLKLIKDVAVPANRKAWGKANSGYNGPLKQEELRRLDGLSFRVLQVIDSQRLLLLWQSTRTPFLVVGHDTKGITDQSRVVLIGPMLVDGTYDYTSVAGSRKTVHRLRFVEAGEASELKEQQEADQFATRWKSEHRTWLDSTESFEINAVYDGYEGNGKIRLIKRDQSELIVPISKLSRSDRNHALDLIKEDSRDRP